MTPNGLPFRRNRVALESLPLDAATFQQIVDDMRRHAGRHLPADVWIASGGGAEGCTAADHSASRLIQPWIGSGAKQNNPESMFWYEPFLRDLDSLGLAARCFDASDAGAALSIADLGTLVDLAMLSPFLPAAAQEPLRIVEVGGGYGRLAEALLNVFGRRIRCLLVDAVPASLAFAPEYLEACNSTFRIGSYYRNDAFDWNRYDCYVVPIWHADKLDVGRFDAAINVQSMQEMDQHHVDFYLDWIDAGLKDGGVAYFCNRRDHVFRGAWRYPSHWECLVKACTPRSWIRDFPAEVFRKGSVDFMLANRLHDALYRRELELRRTYAAGVAATCGYTPY